MAKNQVIPGSVFKGRSTNTSNVIGIIPNNGRDLRKSAQSIAKDETARINYKLFAYGITADAAGTKADATQLDTREVQVITVIAADDDAVKLPQAQPNLYMTIVNKDSANDLAVFSLGTDTLNGSDTLAATVVAGSRINVLAISATEWITL